LKELHMTPLDPFAAVIAAMIANEPWRITGAQLELAMREVERLRAIQREDAMTGICERGA